MKALSVGATKAGLPFGVIFARGILANIFVTLVVWVYSGGKTVVDKIAAMILPIAGFVAVGCEHSIANMFFIPYALLLKGVPGVAAGVSAEQLSHLTWGTFGQNLAASTLGNLVGGSICVGLVYWFAYLWEQKADAPALERKAS